MRKIEQAMAAAIRARQSWQQGNTAVSVADGVVRVTLHGHEIATISPEGLVTLRSCGWRTATTKSRLNAVLEAVGRLERVRQIRGHWIVEHAESWAWDGLGDRFWHEDFEIGRARA